MTDIAFFVQSVEGRPEWPLTRQCIEASDIGVDYECLRQSPQETARTYFIRVMETMHASGADLCVRFEDDLEGVNRHIKHNILTWPSVRDPRFGVGWLMSPGGLPRRSTQDKWHWGLLHMSQGCVFRREDIPLILEHVRHYWQSIDTSPAFTPDLAVTYAASQMGRWTCVHNPSLVRHNELGKSLLGNTHHPQHDSDCGSFSLDFKR